MINVGINNKMKKNIIIVLMISLVFISNAVFGAEELTLEECIMTALKNSPGIRLAEEKVKQSKGAVMEAFSSYLPKLDFRSYVAQKNESDMDLGLLPKEFTAMIADKTFDMQFNVQQPLFTWGKIVNGNKQARAGYDLAVESYRQAKNDLVLNVKKTYFGVLLAQKMVKVTEEMLKVTEAHLKVTESFYKQGKVSGYDVSKVKVQAINVKTNLLRAQNGGQLALEALFNVIGVEKKGEVRLVTEMTYSPFNTDYNKFVNEALSGRPEIEIMEIQKKMSKIALSMSKSGNKPSLVLTGNVDWVLGVSEFEELSFNINDWYRTWNARLILSYPLFDGFQTRAKVKQSRTQLNQSNINRQQLVDGIKMEIRQACFNIKQSEETILAQEENVESARGNLATARERFRGGLVSDVEVRDAQLALSQAESNYFQALHDFNVAIASLDKALGK